MNTFLIIILIGGIITLVSLYIHEKIKGTLQKELMSQKELLEQYLGKQQQSMEFRLDRTSSSLMDMAKLLTEVKESNRRIHDLGKDISSLTQVLNHPKLRGSLGEYLLEEILKTALPSDFLSFQHRFQNGHIVDAAVVLRDNKILPIDAKFPFAAFQKAMEEEDENIREHLTRTTLRDVKKHIDAIHEKYILPEYGTLDMAFMYIPSEAVAHFLYQGDNEHEIIQYALRKRVIPVSPVTLFGYIQVILMGMHGFEIEAKAKQIMSHLSGIERQLNLFSDEFDKVGKHLNNARNAFDEAHKKKMIVQSKFDALVQSDRTEIVELDAGTE